MDFDTLAEQFADALGIELDAGQLAAVAGVFEALSPDALKQLSQSMTFLGRIDGLLFLTDPPTNAMGQPGSVAIDLIHKVFYGPKDAATGWPEGEAFLSGPQGPALELRKTETHIQWRVEGSEDEWTDLVPLATLHGAEVSLQKSETHVQWRLGDGEWQDLIPLAVLRGADGSEVSLQTNGTHIQWRRGDEEWQDLIPLALLVGARGEAAWSPVLAAVPDGERRVLRIADWIGGEGDKPATGAYLGPAGFVATAAEATNFRGAAGAGTGDMLAANNLSDLEDEGAARTNLDVWSKGEADGRYRPLSEDVPLADVAGLPEALGDKADAAPVAGALTALGDRVQALEEAPPPETTFNVADVLAAFDAA